MQGERTHSMDHASMHVGTGKHRHTHVRTYDPHARVQRAQTGTLVYAGCDGPKCYPWWTCRSSCSCMRCSAAVLCAEAPEEGHEGTISLSLHICSLPSPPLHLFSLAIRTSTDPFTCLPCCLSRGGLSLFLTCHSVPVHHLLDGAVVHEFHEGRI